MYEKWDKDLDTITSLNKLANEFNSDMVLKGGYAVEAYTGGRQRRPHGDIDTTLYLKIHSDFEKIASSLDRLLTNEDTRWENFQTKEAKIEYREKNDSKDFFDRRRLEMSVFLQPDKAYETGDYSEKFLIKSTSEKVETKVMELHELASMKIHNLYMSKNKVGEQARSSNENDYNDLRMLLKNSEFDPTKLIKKLSRIFKNDDASKQLQRAVEEYEFVTRLLLK